MRECTSALTLLSSYYGNAFLAVATCLGNSVHVCTDVFMILAGQPGVGWAFVLGATG